MLFIGLVHDVGRLFLAQRLFHRLAHGGIEQLFLDRGVDLQFQHGLPGQERLGAAIAGGFELFKQMFDVTVVVL